LVPVGISAPESGDQPIQNVTIRCTALGAIQDQEPMFDQNGFRNDAAETSGLRKPENGRDEVKNENNPIAHGQW
jgi:hypothetical protein